MFVRYQNEHRRRRISNEVLIMEITFDGVFEIKLSQQ